MAPERSYRKFGQICEHSAFGPRFSSDEYAPDGNVACLRTMDIDGNGRINFAAMPIAKLEIARFRNHILRRDDLVITRTGAYLGKAAVFTEFRLPVLPGAFSIRFRLKRDVADPRFIRYYFNSSVGQKAIQGIATGSAQPNLNIPNLYSLDVPVPPLAEQKAVAAILGALDDKIELNRRMNSTLEAMARALFKSWFVDFDPVRAKLDGRQVAGLDPATAALFPGSLQDSVLGRIPKGWVAIPLYGTARWVNGAAFRNQDFCDPGEGLPVIKIAELKDGIGQQTKWSKRPTEPDRMIDTGDLLYSWSGSPDSSLEAFLWNGGPGLLNQHIFKVFAPSPAQKRFVYYLLQNLRPVLVETARNKQTTGLGHVTIADMKRLMVCFPCEAVLSAFDRNVAPLFERAFGNSLQSRTLATLRDTLLPKLLSGELGLSR